MKLGYLTSTVIFLLIFLLTVTIQLTSKSHHPFLFWTVIVTTSTAGTTLSDYMDRTLGLGYAKGTLILIALLITIISVWRFTFGNLNLTQIQTKKGEILYWLTVLISNTLGTASGDFLVEHSGLSFLGSWLLISSILLLLLLSHFLTRVPQSLLFWIAFILTRPFGATFGDLLTKSEELGGFSFGRGEASLILLTALISSILTSCRNKKTPTTT